jgi:hypothetical protein
MSLSCCAPSPPSGRPGADRRMRPGHDGISDGRALRLVGRGVPRSPRISRPSAVGTNPSWATLAHRPADRTRGPPSAPQAATSPPTTPSCADDAVEPKRSARSATTSSSPTTTSSATRSHTASSDPTGGANATHPNTARADSNANSKRSATRSTSNKPSKPNTPPKTSDNRAGLPSSHPPARTHAAPTSPPTRGFTGRGGELRGPKTSVLWKTLDLDGRERSAQSDLSVIVVGRSPRLVLTSWMRGSTSTRRRRRGPATREAVSASAAWRSWRPWGAVGGPWVDRGQVAASPTDTNRERHEKARLALSGLPKGTRHKAYFFDPRTGERQSRPSGRTLYRIVEALPLSMSSSGSSAARARAA